MSTPAESLEGFVLDNGWTVGRPLAKTGSQTGGHFSCSYTVESPDGRRAFLKAMDYARALAAPDPATAINELTSAFLFERQLLEECSQRKMSRIVKAIDGGKTICSGQVVEYLVFELADGDIHSYLDASSKFDLTWTLRCIHNICVGMFQLNGANIAHQDLKPSNVLVFGDDGEKLADLGRAWHKTRISPHDDLNFAGDSGYAPPELLYGYLAPEETERRYGADFYMVGSMILFLFTGMRASAILIQSLDVRYHPRTWTGTYQEVLPYLTHAFGENLQMIKEQFADKKLAEEIVDIINQMCHPDLSKRGDRFHHDKIGSRFNLQRITSAFDRLRQAAALGRIAHS